MKEHKICYIKKLYVLLVGVYCVLICMYFF